MTKNPPAASIALPAIKPQIRLVGNIDEQMLLNFLGEFDKLPGEGAVVIELTTMGGEAETGRRIAQELRLLAEHREVYVLGKTYVYSAGVTVLSAVPPERRYLTRDTVLLVHERRFERTVQFSGALRSAVAVAEDLLSELHMAEELERRGFEQFAKGSSLSGEELYARVLKRDWYLPAEEALALKLIGAVVG